ncbi:MAG: DoxX family protein [Acidimicrobiia bacterium]
MHQVCSTLNRFRPAVPLVLRVVLGGLFIWHGIDKFDVGIDMIEEMFTMWGVPAPGLTAPLTAIIEIVAGTMLVLGIGTRIAAMLLSVVMIGALIYVKQDLGIISSQPMPGAELDLAMLAGLIALMILGPGSISVDDKIGLEPSAVELGQREPALANR